MDELIATQHKTLDQFGEEEADKAVKDFKDFVKESGAEVEMRITSGASPVLAEAKRRLEEED
jgi:lipopolysaccharide biosynthesis regulator YciM